MAKIRSASHPERSRECTAAGWIGRNGGELCLPFGIFRQRWPQRVLFQDFSCRKACGLQKKDGWELQLASTPWNQHS